MSKAKKKTVPETEPKSLDQFILGLSSADREAVRLFFDGRPLVRSQSDRGDVTLVSKIREIERTALSEGDHSIYSAVLDLTRIGLAQEELVKAALSVAEEGSRFNYVQHCGATATYPSHEEINARSLELLATDLWEKYLKICLATDYIPHLKATTKVKKEIREVVQVRQRQLLEREDYKDYNQMRNKLGISLPRTEIEDYLRDCILRCNWEKYSVSSRETGVTLSSKKIQELVRSTPEIRNQQLDELKNGFYSGDFSEFSLSKGIVGSPEPAKIQAIQMGYLISVALKHSSNQNAEDIYQSSVEATGIKLSPPQRELIARLFGGK